MHKFDFNLGATIHCRNDKCGKLSKLIVDPESLTITDLIVDRGLLHSEERVVPVSDVERANEDYVYLSISKGELDDYPPYRTYEVDVIGRESSKKTMGSNALPTYISTFGPVMTRGYIPVLHQQRVHRNVGPDLEVIARGTSVCNSQEDLGSIDHMIVSVDSGKLTHLVLDRGLFSNSVILPVAVAEKVDQGKILVDVESDEVDQFPEYSPRADADILGDLRGRLDWDAILDQVIVRVGNGVLRLEGTVPDVKTKRRLEFVARTLGGVVDVENRLRPNNVMDSKVSAALANDPRTALAVIEVIEDRSQVTLRGQVDSPEIQQAAVEIAGAQPGVLNVINALTVREDAYSPVLQAGIPGRLLLD